MDCQAEGQERRPARRVGERLNLAMQTELETIKTALELAQFYVQDYKPRHEVDAQRHTEDEAQIAAAIETVRALIRQTKDTEKPTT